MGLSKMENVCQNKQECNFKLRYATLSSMFSKLDSCNVKAAEVKGFLHPSVRLCNEYGAGNYISYGEKVKEDELLFSNHNGFVVKWSLVSLYMGH